MKFCCWRHWQNYDLITFISKDLYFKKAQNSYFWKIVTMFIKTILKTPKKLKELEIMYQNPIYICISWYSKIC